MKIFHQLAQKYDVIHLHKATRMYRRQEAAIIAQWEAALGRSRVITLAEPKACVDAMLGCIAMLTGARDLDEYLHDMVERGQTEERLAEIQVRVVAAAAAAAAAAATALLALAMDGFHRQQFVDRQ